MSNTFKTVIILRNDASANWLVNSTAVLMRGEVGLEFLESGKVKMKIGDGVATWSELPYFGGETEELSTAIALLEAQVGTLNTDILALMARTAELEAKTANVYTKEEVDSLLSTIYRVKGSVDNYSDLPSDAVIGDVYNIINADSTHGIHAGDNVVWNGEAWDKLGGIVDLTDYVTAKDFEALAIDVKRHAYEITSAPVGTLVDDSREKEIRVCCPKGTEFSHQAVGSTGNADMYYMGFRAYAPNENVVSFKEDLGEIINDNTMYYFENNDFAGIDSYGRKYSICWLALAQYDEATDTWTYFGEKSSTKRFIGWYYTVEWYDASGLMVHTDTIRINLTNEDCHNSIEPYYMGQINVNKLVQSDDDQLILFGGSSAN